MRDPKNKFYKTLNLDEDTKKLLKWFRKTKKELMNDKVKEQDENSIS